MSCVLRDRRPPCLAGRQAPAARAWRALALLALLGTAPAAAGPGSLAEFEDWAERGQPGLLDELLPGGEIDPERPALWKSSLLRWREANRRPIPELAAER